MVLPEKYDSKGSPSPVPTCWSAPRSRSSIIGSPATWLAKRVHRAQSTHRSRSSSTWVEMGTGFSNVRFFPSKRESAPPCDIAWFCRGHSPPLSQTGQSSGWLMSRSSITPFWAFSATGELIWDFTTMPSVQVIVQEAIGLRWPSTSTMHCRRGADRVEERVVAEARDLDAQELGGADDEGALGHADLDAVDRERDEVLGRNRRLAAPGGRTRGDCHAFTPGERSCRPCRRPRGSTGPGRRGSPCR